MNITFKRQTIFYVKSFYVCMTKPSVYTAICHGSMEEWVEFWLGCSHHHLCWSFLVFAFAGNVACGIFLLPCFLGSVAVIAVVVLFGMMRPFSFSILGLLQAWSLVLVAGHDQLQLWHQQSCKDFLFLCICCGLNHFFLKGDNWWQTTIIYLFWVWEGCGEFHPTRGHS